MYWIKSYQRRRRKKKSEKRQQRLKEGNFWWRYYRFLDRKRQMRKYRRACRLYAINPNLIVFESFQGKKFADSPKAIYEEVVRDPAYAGYRFVWIFTDTERRSYLLEQSKRLTLVKYGSKKYYEVLARAKYRVSNSLNPISVPVRSGQIYLQTWHGTPLKCLGLDMKQGEDSVESNRKKIWKQFRKEGKQISYLVSQSAYASEKLSSAFGFTEEERREKILEVGYPRNDSLFTFTEKNVEHLRAFYGVPEGKKVILYAPTCRENGYRYGQGYANEIMLDVDRLQKRFGDKACLMIRTHHMAQVDFDFGAYKGFVIKVTGAEDMNRLFAITDILVTDYSSVMFDFANLCRPMIFYMYDEEQYRRDYHEFYFEPEELPGPVVKCQDLLEDALEKALSEPFVAEERYEEFRKRFVPLDDANAAKRVVEAVFEPQVEPVPVPATGKTDKAKRRAKRRQLRLEKGGFWWKYYRKLDRKTGLKRYNEKCKNFGIDPNLIVFEAYQGKNYACSPKAIYEELLENPAYAGYRFAWSFNDTERHEYMLNRTNRLTLVKRGSDLYYEVMATAKYRISNSTNPATVPVRDGQIYIQTWHGTPLKRLGLDIERDGNAAQDLKEIHNQYREEAKQFTYLLSPSKYTTEKLSSAFGLTKEEQEKKIIEVGYPRNTALFTYTEQEVANLRKFYGIPEGKKVIMYAPTFREGQYKYGQGFSYQVELDIERLQKRFGNTACVVMRTHYLANTQFNYAKYKGFLIKATGVADINRLYLITDLLITDYSSVMFDFSVLRRPMIFYMYDMEQYRGKLRDFYIEPDILPGPIVETQDALENEIEKALTGPFVCDERYEAFLKRFTYLDDADATKRVIAATIVPQAKELPLTEQTVKYRAEQQRIDQKRQAKKKKKKAKEAEYRRLEKRIENGVLRQKQYPRYLRMRIRETAILLESQHGKAMDGNIFALLSELALNEEYKQYQLYLTADNEHYEKFRNRLLELGMEHVTVLRRMSLKYYKILATAKYLINDNTFLYQFVKRKEQVYLNTWHGTPLKTLGKKIKSEAHAIGNTQKNFLAADYLLYPNEFTMEHMVEDYMIDNIGTGEIWLAGYPRNTIFFDKKRREEIRERYELEGLTVYAFLPTWRGVVGGVNGEEQSERLMEYLTELDGKLPENHVLYVKMHTISNAKISVKRFEKIRMFPEDCETYEFLNATDGLITDYSSVFFDYAVSRKKIILFTYDEEEYEAARGFYFPLSELPFPNVKTTDDLAREMTTEKQYDDTAFLEKFCSYERADVSKSICRKLLFGGEEGIKTLPIPDNGKRNVVIFGGSLYQNGITVSLFNLLANIDKEKHNYTILYKMKDVRKHPWQLHRIPEEVHTLGFSDGVSIGVIETVLYKIWSKIGIVPRFIVEPILDRIAKWDSLRIFAGCRVDKLIHFSGYTNDLTTTFRGLSCNKTIYVHNDMEKEVRERNLVRMDVLTRAYQEYDSVAVVTEDIKYIAERIAERLPYRVEKKAYVTVAKNVIDYKRVLNLAECPVRLDSTTEMNVSLARLKEILESDGVKFVNVGRFSPEKGHDRLLDAFEKIYEEDPNTYLIIIGSRGTQYQETLRKAQSLRCHDHVVTILFMSNPFAVVKQCDYFIFSSLYEGFGLVLAEADILGVRCVSTDIDGPRKFMQKYGGTLVEDSMQGVYEGMRMCLDGKITNLLTVDYEEYNKEAVAEFERIAAMDNKKV